VRLLRKALGRTDHRIIALCAFLGLFLFNVPFPAVILVAAAFGALTCADQTTKPTALPWRASLAPIIIGGLAWAAPLVVAWSLGAVFLLTLGLFFSKLAVVTFGGAYAVLAGRNDTRTLNPCDGIHCYHSRDRTRWNLDRNSIWDHGALGHVCALFYMDICGCADD